MKASPIPILLLISSALCLPACTRLEAQHAEGHHEHTHKIVVTRPEVKDVVNTKQYVCQIHSCRHIEVRALEGGYLEQIAIREGQVVKKGDTLFDIVPTLYEARLDSEIAEAQLAQIELSNTQNLFNQNVVSKQEVALAQAKLAKAQAKVNLAKAELNFTNVKAPFDGIVDRLHEQQGSLIEEGAMLTTLSDNSVMWVYFNVPEAQYLEYMEEMQQHQEELQVELMLANGQKFSQTGKIGAIEADFNNETGNIAFRADFSNPNGLLRHGQTGTILISRVEKNAVVIPQRATYDVLAKKYVYVVEDSDGSSLKSAHGGEHGEEGHAADSHATHESATAEHATAEHAVAEHHADEAHHDGHEAAEHSTSHEAKPGHYGIVHQREIEILNEQEDVFLIKGGLGENDKIILEGVQQVHDGEEVEFEYRSPEDVLSNLKFKAE
ncbi:efflux RND transporter periplasmic adaptor subunit [Stieleria sp. JC731]|uniref:efflux RND transporter periplasmic adaptor subunit n=1 Tax=Pirellulaceae TaxID=2691357 RepID=UPI001E44C3A6|nr:efflux RND transporter periplasmic adaptor subunit [Stieleria sp. JC731]MCC9602404.1 efflux RND transporter periplasmic adaptor subunit [Stieleria sp. JC731]